MVRMNEVRHLIPRTPLVYHLAFCHSVPLKAL
jgi:hypothetical protein